MNRKMLASKMTSRILDSVLKYSDVSNLVYEALDFNMESIQVFPNMIPKVKEVLNGRCLNICAVISYPHGIFSPEQKAFEIEDAIEMGATQVEVAAHLLNIRSGEWDKVREEFSACRKAAKENILKVIIEVEFLTEEQIRTASQIAMEAGVDRIVTSVGVYDYAGENGQLCYYKVTKEEVAIIKSVVGDQVKVVAQGRVLTSEKAIELLESGADYVASEEAVKILRTVQE